MNMRESLWFMNACRRASLASSRCVVCRRSVKSRVIFRKPRSVQDVYLQVHDLETNLPIIVSDIARVVGKELRGAEVYDRTADCIDE